MNKILFSSKSVEWGTPINLYKQLDFEFSFSLDPCASKENAKCKKFFTIEDNGLLQSWKGENVFCNPPYGKEIGYWVRKAHNEFFYNGCDLVVLLLPARTDTLWFHNYLYGFAEIRFIRGRLSFNEFGRAPFPSMIAIFRR